MEITMAQVEAMIQTGKSLAEVKEDEREINEA